MLKYDLGSFDVETNRTELSTYWESSDGIILPMDDKETYWILWGSPRGWSGQTGAPETANLPDFSAERLTRTKFQRRTPSLTIVIHAGSRDELESRCVALISAFRQERGLGRLHIKTANGQRVYIDCMAASGYPEITMQSVNTAFASVSLIAPDPRYYAEELVSIGANGQTINPGDASSPCILTASADTISSSAHTTTITNVTGTTLVGVIIDTTPGHLRAEYNGANAMHRISMNSNVAKFTIEPGAQTITGVSALSYRPAWRGRMI